ncbi:MAG: imidazole glycerol phosphate synthase subunit HisH [Candidatus Omnitrophica bacterium]|nr:imidazole glycerol phosphate synthase subunit HisH [Candidatus Omnitrophota bacterium]
MTIIVDYGMGNLRSVAKAAEHLGKGVRISDKASIIDKATKIVFPGVGHFAGAVKELKKRKLIPVLKKKIKDGIPFLGICVGMQLLFESSEEAPGVKGLGVVEGVVKKFKNTKLIVPHMGWNQVQTRDQRPETRDIFDGVDDGSYFYFAHSYYCKPKKNKTILTTTNYGINFASSLRQDNVWGVQFHPEKSQKLGLKVFNNFLNL